MQQKVQVSLHDIPESQTNRSEISLSDNLFRITGFSDGGSLLSRSLGRMRSGGWESDGLEIHSFVKTTASSGLCV